MLPRGFGVPEGGGTGWEGRAPHPAVETKTATTRAARGSLNLPEEVAQFFISDPGGS